MAFKSSKGDNPVTKAANLLALKRLQRTQSWQLVFVGLFTSLLAFFVLLITLVEIEGVRSDRDYQRFIHTFTQEVEVRRDQLGLDWLSVENTFAKGIRLSFDPDLFARHALFEPARAKINPFFLPHLNRLSHLLETLSLPQVPQRYQKWVRSQHQADETFQVSVRVEGHTDANPLAPTAMYASNVELSSVRAWAIMDYLRMQTQLPGRQFVIAGYGAQEPLVQQATADINRRVELYLQPEALPKMPEARQ